MFYESCLCCVVWPVALCWEGAAGGVMACGLGICVVVGVRFVLAVEQ